MAPDVPTRGFVLLALVVLLIGIASPGCLDEEGPRYGVSLDIYVTASGPTTMILPMSECARLDKPLHVEEGRGRFERIITIHGPALMVETDDETVQVRAHWGHDDPSLVDEMTNNLTTMDPNITDPTPWSLVNHSLPDRSTWVNWTSGAKPTIWIFSRMWHKGIEFEYRSIYNYELTEGWLLLPLETHISAINAP